MSEDDLDNFVEKMQAQIFEETRETYGEVAFQRWFNPLYMGIMKNPDGHARITGPCGDTMEIFLRFENDRVREASFITDGCGGSSVCGSFAAEMAIGRTPDELIDITGEDIIGVLGRFPKEDQHCCFLAAGTLQEALNNYMIRQLKKKTNKYFLNNLKGGVYMPRGDGTGPAGQGQGTGRGMGRNKGGGVGMGREGGLAKGQGGYCVCPKCGKRTVHHAGTPCFNQMCPKCGTAMTRE